MIAHPAAYWAKYLISMRSMPLSSIEAVMTASQLAGVTEAKLQELLDELVFPDPFLPQNIGHAPSRLFLKEHGIYELWYPDSFMNAAQQIKDDRRLRKTTETLLLSPFTITQSVKKLQSSFPRFRKVLSQRAVELFQHFWWNTELMTPSTWADFLVANSQAERELCATALAVRGVDGAQLLLHKLKLGTVTQMSSNRAFQTARNGAAMAIAVIAEQDPSPEHADMLLKYVKCLRAANDGMATTGGAEEDIVSSLRRFQLRTKETDIQSIDELSGGEFSLPVGMSNKNE